MFSTTTYVISQLVSCLKFALMFLLSHLYSPSVVKSSLPRLPMVRTILYARGFWAQRQGAFLDVRVFHPNAPSYHHSSIPSVYRRHELQKKREYSVREVELASFTPLVFGTTGGMGKEALVFYCRLADRLSRHDSMSYSSTLAWIRCTLSFSLLRSATMCIRGTRSISYCYIEASPQMGHADGLGDFCKADF